MLGDVAPFFVLVLAANVCLQYQGCFWDSENKIMNSETRCYEVQGGRKMALFDWNQNGKKDIVDNCIEYQIYKNSTQNKETNNYSSNETNGMSTFSALVVVIGGMLIAGMFATEFEEMPGIVVILLWFLASIGIAFLMELFKK